MNKQHSNKVIADHGTWLEVEVGTKKYPDAILKIDTEDFERISKSHGRISCKRPSPRHYLYCVATTGSRTVLVHKLIKPQHKRLNHINLCGMATGLDNRKENLEPTNHSANGFHTHLSKSNKTGVSGVIYSNKKDDHLTPYKASIRKRPFKAQTASFTTLDEAKAWRKEKELELFGETKLNLRRVELAKVATIITR